MKDLRNADTLPDCALVDVQMTTGLLGTSVSTGWRKIKTDPDFPKPIRLGARCTRFRMGDIRAYIASKEVTA